MKSVYLLQSESGLYKIGVSTHPARRLKQLQTGNGEKITLLYSFECEIPFLLETSLKNRFMLHRVSGEWFNLPLEDEINFISICQKLHGNLKLLKDNQNIFL